MLILSAAAGEVFKIGDTFLTAHHERGHIRLVIDAPYDIPVNRVPATSIKEARAKWRAEGDSCLTKKATKAGR